MEVRIVERKVARIAGFGFFGDPFDTSEGWTEENGIGKTWKRLEAYLHREGGHGYSDMEPGRAYELHVYHDETPRTGEFEVMVGMEIDDLEDVPVELTVKVVPSGTYAMLTLRGEQIISDWHMALDSDYLPKAGYQRLPTHSFQLYDERFIGLDRLHESVMEAFIPVVEMEG